MATTPKILTYEEWLQMPEVHDRIEEVVNGKVRIMPPNRWVHTRVVQSIRRQLEYHLNPDLVYVVDSVFGLVIHRDPLTTRVPDIAVLIAANIVEVDGYIHSAPELVVEVLSPANTKLEREQKIRDYESLGVPELWVVSPEARTVEIMRLTADRKLETVVITNEGVIRPTLFPDTAVEIAHIWPR